MRNSDRLLAVLAGLILLGTAACSSADKQTELAATELASPQGPAGLPLPSELAGKQSTYSLQDGHRSGADYAPLLPFQRVQPLDTTLLYTPNLSAAPDSLDGLAFATYDFTLPDYDGAPKFIEFFWDGAAPTGELHVALASWELDRWRWHSGISGNKLFLDSLAPYLNGDDRVLVVVAVSGTSPASLIELQLEGQGDPEATLTPEKSMGPAPLQVDFDGSASVDHDGSLVNYEWDLDGDGVFSEIGVENGALGDPVPPTYTYVDPGIYFAALRISDDAGKTAEASALVVATGGPAPTAVLSAEPLVLTQGLSVQFDASESNDPSGGTIELYEWDFDGDQIYDEAGDEHAAFNDPAPSFVFEDNGFFDPGGARDQQQRRTGHRESADRGAQRAAGRRARGGCAVGPGAAEREPLGGVKQRSGRQHYAD